MDMSGSDTVRQVRQSISKKFGQNEAGFIMTHVYNNKFEQMHSCKKYVDDLYGQNGLLLVYELPPELKEVAKFPEVVDKRDSN